MAFRLDSVDLLNAPGVTGAVPDFARARIRAEQIYSIIRYTPATMVANVSNAIVLVVSLLGTPHESIAMGWAFVVCTFSAFHYLKGVAIRQAPKPSHVSERTIRRAITYATVLGALWGAVPLLFFQEVDESAMLVIVCLCCGMLCGGAVVLAAVPAAALAFTLPVLIGSLIAIARSDVASQVYLAALFVTYAYVLMLASFTHARQLARRLIRQFEAEDAARQDALTALPNAVAFRDGLTRALQRVTDYGEQAAIIYLDLDGFKPINDRYGHAAGDEILVQVAARLNATIRTFDLVARLGGDEFAIALVDVGGPVEVMACAERLIKAFEPQFVAAGAAQTIGVSIGIAMAPSDGVDAATLLGKADHALYQAKAGGGGHCRFFDASHASAVKERRELEADLRIALGNGEISLAFQPVMDIASGRVVGCEALARWSHPVRGTIPPDEFIPMAERTGLIQEIGEWIIGEACRVARLLPDHVSMSVNVSVAQLRGEALLSTLRRAIADHGLTPDRLEIEITESLLIARDDPAIDVARRIAAAGFPIALDDFGTGYASLNYLRKLPLKRVKIDREFVHDSLTHADCAAIVAAVMELARVLDLQVTAEGVETEEQLYFLKAIGCRAAQGYLIAKPLGEDDLLTMLDDEAAKMLAA